MSITPQFLDQLRDRVPLSEVIGRFVTWDQKKSRPAQGDYWSPCPFHSEKTASFHADDRKGFYYCFGCHQKGDAINFLKDKANLSFVEAVRELAGMAGMKMPEYSPEAKEKADENARLIEMHENAARFFSLQLHAVAGTQARDYLHNKRGLSAQTIEEFGIGFIPNARDLLLKHLREAGFKDDEILAAGLALKPDESAKDDHSRNFDRFRNRIMFPIHDGRGRVIAFGGRAMDENAKAKYLNSADSPIFHKGRVVYNLHRARQALSDEGHFILAEGYMDVIALAQAGFHAALAPLGTAITLDQLEILWRMDQAPILALDGDAAGQRAAERAANLALPRISAERSLQFAMMPAGQDPDDLIKAGGSKAMRDVLQNTTPMVDLLWAQAIGAEPLETPEARAAFDGRLKAIAGQIGDASLKSHYMAEFRERRKALWAPARHQTDRRFPEKKSTPKRPSPKPDAHLDLRVALILRTILTYPELGANFKDDLAQLKCPNPRIDGLRKEVILTYGDKAALEHLATQENLEILSAGSVLGNLRIFHDENAQSKALEISTDDIHRATIQAQAKAEIDEILNNLRQGELTEDKEAMLKNAVMMRDEARKIFDDHANDDEDSRAFLRQFLESERWRK